MENRLVSNISQEVIFLVPTWSVKFNLVMEDMIMLKKFGNWFNHFKNKFFSKLVLENIKINIDEKTGLYSEIYFIFQNKYKNLDIKDIHILVEGKFTGEKRLVRATSYYQKDDKILVKIKTVFDKNKVDIKNIEFNTSVGRIKKGVNLNESSYYRKSQV
jgi:hypothetical protein